MKDFLELYNKLTEMCFSRCVSNFNSKPLTGDEDTCVGRCVDRYVKYNQRLMMTFMEFQNAKQEAAVKEMEQAVAEGRTPNLPGLAQGLVPQTGDQVAPQSLAVTEHSAQNPVTAQNMYQAADDSMRHSSIAEDI